MLSNMRYLYRCLAWNLPDQDHHQRFPNLPIPNDPNHIRPIPIGKQADFGEVPIHYRKQVGRQPLERFLQQSGTTSFLILQRNRLVYESYFNGYSANSMVTSFSIAKSLMSMLVGIALQESTLPGLDHPIRELLPEIGPKVSSSLTIRHLLTMTSGLAYDEGVMPWSDDARIYYGLNLRRQALRCQSIEEPGQYYHYNNYNLLLLGLLLEQATGMSVPTYFSRKIWSRLGAESAASWSTDSEASAFSKIESGFNARARDFARLGLLYLNNGRIDNEQLILADWIRQSTSPPEPHEIAHTDRYRNRKTPPLCQWVSSSVGYYKHLWWGYRYDPVQQPDYFAMGILGQFIYVSPASQTVVVRFGKKWGNIDWWPGLFRELLTRL